MYLTKEQILKKLKQLSRNSLVQLINSALSSEIEYKDDYEFELPDKMLKESRYKSDLWIETVEKLPRKLKKVPEVNKALIQNCKQIWAENCLGNEHIRDLLIDHVIEYCTTYSTKPIILVGAPGCGKTLAAEVYALMLNLERVRVDAPLSAHGRGLSGECGSYQDASCGTVVEGMINTKNLNYLLHIDEIDKAAPANNKNIGLQDEILKLTDESNVKFMDNLLQFPVPACFIPIIFTANNIDDISLPLKDRCEVVKFSDLKKIDIFNIVNNFTVPKKMREMQCEGRVEFTEDVIHKMVDMLWDKGEVSARPYQQLVSSLISKGIKRSIETEEKISISEKDIDYAIQYLSLNNARTKLGFVI